MASDDKASPDHFDSKALWQLVKPLVRRFERDDGVVIEELPLIQHDLLHRP
ncbi:MAG: hypothetical protein KGZ60_09985 [Truepera sp.]|nr:hypothetical protein [Truepera sp.]